MRLPFSLLIVGLAVSLAAPAAHAQPGAAGDTLVFEHVGDQPIDMNDLAFDEAGALWAIGGQVWRLAPGATTWEEVGNSPGSYILPIGPDTLLAGFNAGDGGIRRSLDGGRSWPWDLVSDFGLDFFASSTGRLLVGSGGDVVAGYSDDRGATWHEATFTGGDPGITMAVDQFPDGHPQAGRLVAACFGGGLMYSDDDGRTWHESSLWEGFGFNVTSVAVGSDGRAWATAYGDGVPGATLYGSADGGETWAAVGHNAFATRGTAAYVVALPGGAGPGVLVVVGYNGNVWRSVDGAESWRLAGRIPYESELSHATDVIVDAEGRLYVAVIAPGGDDEWVYRTTAPVVAVSSAHPPPRAPEAGVEVHVFPNPAGGVATAVLTLAAPEHVRVVVYDVQGREVAVLHDGPAAGRLSVPVETPGWAPGVYVVRAEAGGQTATARLVVTR